MDANSVEGEEKTVLDYIKIVADVWPFSLLFRKDIPEEIPIDVTDGGGDDKESSIKLPPRIIGHNLDHGIDYGLGMLHFVIKYEVYEKVLKVIIFQGKNLVGKDPRGTSDPYAVVSFAPPIREDDYKTDTKMKTLNPIWNHVFSFQNFPENDLLNHKLHITLYDWDKYGSHEPLGEVYYDLEKLHKKEIVPSIKDDNMTTSAIDQWIAKGSIDYDIAEPVRSSSPITEEDYRVIEKSVSMIFVNNDSFDEEEEEEEVEVRKVNPVQKSDSDSEDALEQIVNIIRRIEIKKNLQALPNSRSAFGELLLSLNYSIRTRRLVVTIVKARNVIDPSRRSLITYCTLRHLFIDKDRELTKSMHRTSFRFYTTNPVWNEEFQLKVAPEKLKRSAVEIQVFHSTKSVNPNDELLGLIRLGLKAYPGQKAHWVEFLSNIGKPISHWHLIRS